MRSARNARISFAVGMLVAAGAAAVQGCAADARSGDHESVGEENEALMGNINYLTNDSTKVCSSTEQTFINNAARYGRIVAGSNAYSMCVAHAMRYGINVSDDSGLVNYMGGLPTLGPYQKCNENGVSDPTYYDKTDYNTPELSGEIEHAIADARSPNDVQIGCDPGLASGLAAQADGVIEEAANPERFWFQKANLDRYAATNFISFTSGTIWHEAMHQHAYHHAGGPATGCGYTNAAETDNSWMVRHTIPYIVGNCMRYVIDQAQGSALCNALQCDTANEVPVLNTIYASTVETCACARDPHAPPKPPVAPSNAPSCGSTVSCGDALTVQCRNASEVFTLQRFDGSTWTTVSTDSTSPRYGSVELYDQGRGDSATYRACASAYATPGTMNCGTSFVVTFPHNACPTPSGGGGGGGGHPKPCGGHVCPV